MDDQMRGTGRVVVLVLPEVNLLDLGGPVQVFDAASQLGAGYRIDYVAESVETVSAQGLRSVRRRRVERAHGPALTAAVARQLVLYLRRAGTGEQISPFLRHRSHLHSAVHRVQDHLAQHVDAVAARCGFRDARHFRRLFTDRRGMPPSAARTR